MFDCANCNDPFLLARLSYNLCGFVDKKLYSALALFFSYLIRLDLDMISKTSFTAVIYYHITTKFHYAKRVSAYGGVMYGEKR